MFKGGIVGDWFGGSEGRGSCIVVIMFISFWYLFVFWVWEDVFIIFLEERSRVWGRVGGGGRVDFEVFVGFG